jgi:SNF2 family DNA or RNA helicase
MYSFQDDALDWMKIRELDTRVTGGFLCHEMGLGKTRMMCRLISENLRPVTLVLTTKSTLHGWLDELREQSQFKFDVLEFKNGKIVPELESVRPRPRVIVGTHQSVLKTFPSTVDRIVIDEGHVIRNRGAIYVAVMKIAARYKWLMTATPYNNRNSDIGAYTEFLKLGLPASAFKHYALRKTRKDVYPDGPVIKVRKYIYEFETEEERRLYDFVEGQIENVEEWIHHNRGRVPRHVLNTIGFGLMIRKRQATIHPQIVLDAEKRWRNVLGESDPVDSWKTNVTKFKHILEMVKKDQSEQKNTMIVTHFQRELELLHETLTSAGIHVEILNGHTTPDERRLLEKKQACIDIVDALRHTPVSCVSELIASFVSPPTVILLQIKAGGVGLSLPWVHHVINTSPDWNPFLELQAMYRAYRITTKHDVDVTNMYFKKTIDIHIQDQQARKLLESLRWTGDAEDTITEFISMPIV